MPNYFIKMGLSLLNHLGTFKSFNPIVRTQMLLQILWPSFQKWLLILGASMLGCPTSDKLDTQKIKSVAPCGNAGPVPFFCLWPLS